MTEYAVGDINSSEKGSGARANGNKPDWSLMPLYQCRSLSICPNYQFFIDELSVFQLAGGSEPLQIILKHAIGGSHNHGLGIELFHDTCRVWEMGKQKYNAWNWSKGMAWSIPLACAVRHLIKYYVEEEELDEESGITHLAHFICNIQMLIHYTKYYPEGNDLPKWGEENT